MDSLLVLLASGTAFPKEGSAIESLRQQIDLQAAFFRSSRGNLIRPLVAEVRSRACVCFSRPVAQSTRREGVREILLAAIAEGSLRRNIDVDTAIDLLHGSLYYRLLLGSGTLHERFIDLTYQQFLAGHGVL